MPPSADVTPGMWGFTAFALLAVALYFLMRNMTSRMRRMDYRQRDAHRTADDPQAWDGDGPVDSADDADTPRPRGRGGRGRGR